MVKSEHIEDGAVGFEKLGFGFEGHEATNVLHDTNKFVVESDDSIGYYTYRTAVEGYSEHVEYLRPRSVTVQENGNRFNVTNADRSLRFEGSGAVSVGFDPFTHRITIHAEPGITSLHAENGLEATQVGSEVWVGIKEGGVTWNRLADAVRVAIESAREVPITSEEIADRTIRGEDIARGAISNYEIAGRTIFVTVQENGTRFNVTNADRRLRFVEGSGIAIDLLPGHGIRIRWRGVDLYDYRSRTYKPVHYLAGTEGLRSWKQGDYGYVGIADKGVTTSKLADRGVTASKLKVTSFVATIPPRGGIEWIPVSYLDYTVSPPRFYYYNFPLSFGRAVGGSGYIPTDTWNLSDFGTAINTGYFPSAWNPRYACTYFIIKNVTLLDSRTVRILAINNPSVNQAGEAITTKFYCIYNTENGEILSVTKTDEEITLFLNIPKPIPNTSYYLLDTHPEREEIFRNPEAYVVDLMSNTIRKRIEGGT